MIKKWLPRIMGLILIALVITVTRDYYYTYVVPYSRAKTEQELIWAQKAQANKERAEQKAKEEAEEAKRKEEAVAKKAEEERLKAEEEKAKEEALGVSEATGDDFFLDLGHYKLWESGEYDTETGEKQDNKRRLRYPKFIDIDCPEYNILLSEGYSVVVCEYDSDKNFIRSIVLQDKEVYKASKLGQFFTVYLKKDEGEKSLSLGQWNRLFGEGLTVKICTNKWLDYSASDLGSLIEKPTVDFDKEELSDWLLAGEDDILADALWKMQIANEVYTLIGEELNNGNLTYYVSSSEGDDNNSGLDMEHPKKTLDAFSSTGNVNILLKCGDVFDMRKGFRVGNNSMYAAYGEGARPILNYYRKLEVDFKPQGEYENLWVADLSSLRDIVTENKNKSNCNIGQLLINGETNWKRVVWSTKAEFSPKSMINDEGCWAVDWTSSKLYYYAETNPNDLAIEYSPPIIAFELDKAHDVTIKGLEIKGAGKHGCNISDSSNINIKCCYFNHIGGSILVQAGVRYGNAVQIWDSGSNININDNYSAWIFDTCYTNQGTDVNAKCNKIYFKNNIGTHFFWGIETWGEGYSDTGFSDIVYVNNILFDNIDVTNPNTPMHVGKNARLLGLSDSEYVSYRNGYKYHQMASINFSNSGKGEFVRIDNNIICNSNRFLVLANNSRSEDIMSSLKDNIFFCKINNEQTCLIRIKEGNNNIYYKDGSRFDGSNKWFISENDSSEELRKYMTVQLSLIFK